MNALYLTNDDKNYKRRVIQVENYKRRVIQVLVYSLNICCEGHQNHYNSVTTENY